MTPRLIIAAATAMEMRAVLQGAGVEATSPEVGGWRSAHVGDIPVRFLVTGVGPLAAAFSLGRMAGEGLLAPEKCRGVACFGIAGTYAPEAAPLGSVVFATREIWPEYGLATENGVDAKALGFPLVGEKNDTNPPPVWNTLDNDDDALDAMGLYDPSASPHIPAGPFFTRGPSITVAGVSGTPALAARLASQYGAMTENMEGFPLALVARKYATPFFEARSVSNVAGERNAASWDIPQALSSLSRAVSLLFAE